MSTTNRTLQFLGLAYGNSDVTITATIDNVVVYNDTVATSDKEMLGTRTDWTTTNQLFAVENSDQFPIEFSGSRVMSITVSGGEGIFLTHVLSNYMAQYTQVGNIFESTPGNAATFFECYTGKPTNSEETSDCRSNVVIDGVAPEPYVKSTGIWTWQVNNGSTLVCNLSVGLGNVA